MNITPVPINRILVADPKPAALSYATLLGENMNCEVIAVPDGREAYRMLHGGGSFVCVILNLVLPYLDAPGIIKFMKTEKRLMLVPVMIMTDIECYELVTDGLKAGACGLLQKPYTADQFKGLLQLMLNQKHKLYPSRISRPTHLKLAPVAKRA